MSFIVVHDACVLCPNTLRDLLIRIHQAGLVQAKWTEEILDEVSRNLVKNLPDITPEKVERLRRLMVGAVRDCLVRGYEPLIEALHLPDPDDRHVVAAALRAKAQVIVTDNTKDFPADYLAGWDIDVKTADEFVLDQISLNWQAVYGELVRIADSRNNPPQSVSDELRELERPEAGPGAGLIKSVAALSSD